MNAKLKISRGLYKGRFISTKKLENVRPTKSILIESLCSVIGENLYDKKCVDFYFGSGIVGLHFLSLEARFVQFYDSSKKNCIELKRQLEQLDVPTNKFAIEKTAIEKIKSYPTADFVWLDPPYDMFAIDDSLHLLKNIINHYQNEKTSLAIEVPSAKCEMIKEIISTNDEPEIYKYGNSSYLLFSYF